MEISKWQNRNRHADEAEEEIWAWVQTLIID